MKKFDVLVIGELNVDLILNHISPMPEIGKEVTAKSMSLTLGSSSAIFASNLSRLGSKVAFVGKVGKDQFGEFLLQSLKSFGVDCSSIHQEKHLQTGATVALNLEEDRAMVTYQGAMNHLRIEDIEWEKLAEARHLHLSSYFIQKGIQQDVKKLFQTAKAMGLSTSFDTQWDPEEQWNIDLVEILPYVDVFLPNETELLHLTHTQEISAAIEAIKAHSHLIVVKRGHQGSVCHHEGRLLSQNAFINNDVVDAIGAGDSFNAGFVHKFIQKQSCEECQEFANLVGAVSTTGSGGTSAFKAPHSFYQIAKEKFGFHAHETSR